jgi:hypothetical protein
MPQQDAVFPSYTGSIWRGYFGARLRRMVCVTDARSCKGCGHVPNCAYAYLFETAPPDNAPRMRKYTSVPHPLVLAPPPVVGRQAYPQGSVFPLTVHLFGHACESLSLIAHVLAMVGEAGPGRSGVPMRLFEIHSDQLIVERRCVDYRLGMDVEMDPVVPVPPPCPGEPIRLRLITPLRIVGGGRIVGPDRFVFRGFFSGLLRRISMLTVFHTEQPLETDFAGLVKLAEAVALVATDLRWQEWQRHSARQKRTLPMGGLLGGFTVDLAGAEALWPYLWLGQRTHVGKGAIMGLGEYEIENKAAGSAIRHQQEAL